MSGIHGHRRGNNNISRFILTGSNAVIDGLIGHSTVDGDYIVTYPAYLHAFTVQYPQPRGNTPIGAYINPLTGTDSARFLFWDTLPFNVPSFAGNPIPGLPHPDDAALVVYPWGNGASGGGAGSDPASIRTSTDGPYVIHLRKQFRRGLFGYFENPVKRAVITYNNLVGGPFTPGRILLGNGGAAGGAIIESDNGADTLILQAGSVGVDFTVGAALTENPAGATADVVTYEAELIEQLNCQVNIIWIPLGDRRQR